MKYELLVIGTSAGGIDALKRLLGTLPNPMPIPVLIIQHLSSRFESFLPSILETSSGISCQEINDKDVLKKNSIYVAPPNYHVLVEKNHLLTLTTEKRISFARPSIDVTFETASDAFRNKVIGVLLTGANRDGAMGLKTIHRRGGLTFVQNPKTAYAPEMPRSALKLFEPSHIMTIEEIGKTITNYIQKGD